MPHWFKYFVEKFVKNLLMTTYSQEKLALQWYPLKAVE